MQKYLVDLRRNKRIDLLIAGTDKIIYNGNIGYDLIDQQESCDQYNRLSKSTFREKSHVR